MTGAPGAPGPARVGIFGGSFDPPHIGHLLSVMDAMDALALDRVQVVPAGTQPLKGQGVTAAADRLAMTQACFAGVPRVVVDPIEIQRGGLSYMVDTVKEFRRQWPAADLMLLLGADAASALDRWHAPERLLREVQLIVLNREGAGHEWAEPWRGWADIRPPRRLATRRVDVSSSEIRTRVAAGRPINGFVPASVAAYIAVSGLYLSRNAC